MTDPGVIDLYFAQFNRFIDSGFGLLRGDVGALASTLMAIDVTLAALLWAQSSGEDVIARLIRKVIYVGFFAFLITNFQSLANIVLESFTRMGLKASGTGLSVEDMLRPGKLAMVGVDAAKPLLEAAADLSGFPGFFENIVQVCVLGVAFLLIVAAFFIIAVQVFVVLIEFKLASLIGFALVPFGPFGRTAFMAERVLGQVLASGVKVMALAVVVGIGSTMFDSFRGAWTNGVPTLEQVLALVLASLVLLGLSIFCPGIASGLLSGAPQLGAGAAAGTGLAVGGLAMAGMAAGQIVAGGGASLARQAALAGAGARGGEGGSAPPNGPSPPPSSPSSPAPPSSPPASPSTPKSPGSSAAPSGGSARGAGTVGQEASSPGRKGTGGDDAAAPPAWARELERRQRLSQGVGMAVHAVSRGDGQAGGAAPSLSET